MTEIEATVSMFPTDFNFSSYVEKPQLLLKVFCQNLAQHQLLDINYDSALMHLRQNHIIDRIYFLHKFHKFNSN